MSHTLFELRDELAEVRQEKDALLSRLVELLLDEERIVNEQTSAAMALREAR
jgi:hypothetical protein